MMSFEEVLLEAIDEGFSWLGESEKQAIYSYLEKKYKISKQDIPYRIDDFTHALENTFGVGAKLIEIRIMKCLFNKIGKSFPDFDAQEGLEFIEYINAARVNKNRWGYFKKNFVYVSH
jgi:hypothetical protein